MLESRIETCGNVLSRLIHPITPKEFIDSYFGLRPLYIPRQKEKLNFLFNRKRFFEALNKIPQSQQYSPALKGAIGRGAPFPIQAFQAKHIIQAGGTICVSSIHDYDQQLSKVANEIKTYLNFAGAVGFHCYFSGQDCGFTTHFDARIATTLQIEGRKRWRYSASPAILYPRQNATVRSSKVSHLMRSPLELAAWEQINPPDESQLDEVVLEPGDVLCLPAGTWHEAQALGGESLALNLFFDRPDFSSVLLTIMDEEFAEKPEWRKGVSPSLCHSLSESLPPTEMYEEWSERFQQMATLLSTLKHDRSRLTHIWNRVISSYSCNGRHLTNQEDPSDGSLGHVTRQDALAATQPAALHFTRRLANCEDEVLAVYFGPVYLELPSECLPLLVRVKQGSTFLVRDVFEIEGKAEGVSVGTLQSALEKLLQSCILEKRHTDPLSDFWVD